MAACCVLALTSRASQLEVGPGHAYSTIESAYGACSAGDTIAVYPQSGAQAYARVALLLRNKQNVHIRGMAGGAGQRVLLDGQGFDYSGVLPTPRAMFQFDPGSDGGSVEGFEIQNCQNGSHNGAAFRINQSNNITVRNCSVHDNDMGIMSNGSVAANTAANQLIEDCVLHDNGSTTDPGYNHNFYVGGTSIAIRGCEVYNATTGHNVKSRAHLTIVEGCYIHDSPNREFDLVDAAGTTDQPQSHALVSGCTIVKKSNTSGNRATIHFGQDGGGGHTGTLYLINCTILTPYQSPVVDLSAAGAGVQLHNCLVADPGASASTQTLVGARSGASMSDAGAAPTCG